MRKLYYEREKEIEFKSIFERDGEIKYWEEERRFERKRERERERERERKRKRYEERRKKKVVRERERGGKKDEGSVRWSVWTVIVDSSLKTFSTHFRNSEKRKTFFCFRMKIQFLLFRLKREEMYEEEEDMLNK